MRAQRLEQHSRESHSSRAFPHNLTASLLLGILRETPPHKRMTMFTGICPRICARPFGAQFRHAPELSHPLCTVFMFGSFLVSRQNSLFQTLDMPFGQRGAITCSVAVIEGAVARYDRGAPTQALEPQAVRASEQPPKVRTTFAQHNGLAETVDLSNIDRSPALTIVESYWDRRKVSCNSSKHSLQELPCGLVRMADLRMKDGSVVACKLTGIQHLRLEQPVLERSYAF